MKSIAEDIQNRTLERMKEIVNESVSAATGSAPDLGRGPPVMTVETLSVEVLALRTRMVMAEQQVSDAHDRIIQLLGLAESAAAMAQAQHQALAVATQEIVALKIVMGFDDDALERDPTQDN